LLIAIVLLSAVNIYSQELTVKDFQATNDLSASTQRRVDLNDEPCGLVKVQLAAANVGFEGNVIPPVDYRDGYNQTASSLYNCWLSEYLEGRRTIQCRR